MDLTATNGAESRPPASPDPFAPQRSCRCTNTLSGARYDFKHMEQLIRKDSAPKNFRAVVDDTEPKNVTLHTLKHTAASRMIRAGVDIVTFCELLGHADIKTTMIYCQSSNETKREAVEKLSRIYSPGSSPAATLPEAQTITKPSLPS